MECKLSFKVGKGNGYNTNYCGSHNLQIHKGVTRNEGVFTSGTFKFLSSRAHSLSETWQEACSEETHMQSEFMKPRSMTSKPRTIPYKEMRARAFIINSSTFHPQRLQILKSSDTKNTGSVAYKFIEIASKWGKFRCDSSNEIAVYVCVFVCVCKNSV